MRESRQPKLATLAPTRAARPSRAPVRTGLARAWATKPAPGLPPARAKAARIRAARATAARPPQEPARAPEAPRVHALGAPQWRALARASMFRTAPPIVALAGMIVRVARARRGNVSLC